MYTPEIKDYAENTGEHREAEALQMEENERAYEKMRENLTGPVSEKVRMIQDEMDFISKMA